ncbi:D-alanyl-D-alanine carboxypeptidase/D-alanyl-D-alanine-endopeptidase [soil metagenome]
MPLKNFGIAFRPVDSSAPTMSLNDEQPFLMASTTKVVTSLAALHLLGPTYRWRTEAFTTAPVGNGRLAGDLVIVGGSSGLTPATLRRWFGQMRAEGLAQVSGQIVLDRFSLLYEQHPGQAATTAAELAPGGPPDPRTYTRGALVVAVQPSSGEKATVLLTPRPPGVTIVNDVLMGGGNCGALARWAPQAGRSGPLQLLVSGRWDASCGRQEIAFVKLPGTGPSPSLESPSVTSLSVASASPHATAAGRAATASPPGTAGSAMNAAPKVPSISVPGMVAALWAESGGQLRGQVVETTPVVTTKPEAGRGKAAKRSASPAPRADGAPWTSQITTSLPEVLREMNKTSNNLAARSLLLSLAPASGAAGTGLKVAQGRVQAWLLTQGLADGDIRIDEGSGQSRAERGKARAMVQLLCNEWRAVGAKAFVDSLPIAGVDGTLANRMRKGSATGRAFLKTGTLSDTRALAGYVLGLSGKVYAVSMMVNDPAAGRATPALDALVEWLAKNG